MKSKQTQLSPRLSPLAVLLCSSRRKLSANKQLAISQLEAGAGEVWAEVFRGSPLLAVAP